MTAPSPARRRRRAPRPGCPTTCGAGCSRTRATRPQEVAGRLRAPAAAAFASLSDRRHRSSSSPPTTPPAVRSPPGRTALAMADRRGLLERLVTALEHPDVDGVLGSPDVVEELLLLGALEGKVVIGSMNRGGLDGADLDDGRPVHRLRRPPASRPAACEGGKMLLRIDDEDAATASTLESCARAVCDLAAAGLMAMVEPLPYAPGRRRPPGARHVGPRAGPRGDAWPSALGTTSAYTWLKLPACDEPATVFGATTLPCVVLGGVPGPGPRRRPALLGPGAARAGGARPRRGQGAALPSGRRRSRRRRLRRTPPARGHGRGAAHDRRHRPAARTTGPGSRRPAPSRGTSSSSPRSRRAGGTAGCASSGSSPASSGRSAPARARSSSCRCPAG